MKKDSSQLHGELMSSIYQFTKDISYHLPPDKIFDTTTSLIDVFVSYERYRESIIPETSKHLEDEIGELPIEKQKRLIEIFKNGVKKRTTNDSNNST